MGDLSRQWARLSPYNCGYRIPTGAVQSYGDGVFPNDALGFRIEISYQADGGQGLTRPTTNSSRAQRNRDPKDPYAQLRRAALHQARTRNCEGLAKAKMNDACRLMARFDRSLRRRNESAVGGKADVPGARLKRRD